MSEREPLLGTRVARALGWSALGQVAIRVLSFASGVVMARLLTKEDFGEFAIALVAVTLLMTINELGVVGSIVQWREQDGDVIDAARAGAMVAIVFSALVYMLAFILAPSFAAATNVPQATGLIRVVALAILIDGVCAMPIALLMRGLHEARLSVAGTVGAVVGLVVSVSLAFAGLGPWAFVWARLAGSAVTGWILVRVAPARPWPAFNAGVSARLIRFGAPLALAAVVAEAIVNVDYVVVGRVLGAATLGIYLLAFNVANWPTSLVNQAVRRVSFAGSALLVQDREKLRTIVPLSTGLMLSLIAPMCTILGVLAPEVIRVVYGSKWLGAVTPLRFLLVLGGLRVIVDNMSDIVVADGRPRSNLLVRLAWLVLLIPLLTIGAKVGDIGGVGAAHVFAILAVVLPLFLALLSRSGIRPVDVCRQAVRPLAAAGLAGVVLITLLEYLQGDLVRLLVGGLVGALVYGAALLPGNPLVGWVRGHLRPGMGATGLAVDH